MPGTSQGQQGVTRKEVKSQKVLVAHLLQSLVHCCEEVVFFSVQKLGAGAGRGSH